MVPRLRGGFPVCGVGSPVPIIISAHAPSLHVKFAYFPKQCNIPASQAVSQHEASQEDCLADHTLFSAAGPSGLTGCESTDSCCRVHASNNTCRIVRRSATAADNIAQLVGAICRTIDQVSSLIQHFFGLALRAGNNFTAFHNSLSGTSSPSIHPLIKAQM